MRCRVCHQPVGTYRPHDTRAVRAERHPQSAYGVGGYQCPGSFGPVDDEPTVARDQERTARWRRNAGGPSLAEYLESKGER
jgi:hypothetical protein